MTSDRMTSRQCVSVSDKTSRAARTCMSFPASRASARSARSFRRASLLRQRPCAATTPRRYRRKSARALWPLHAVWIASAARCSLRVPDTTLLRCGGYRQSRGSLADLTGRHGRLRKMHCASTVLVSQVCMLPAVKTTIPVMDTATTFLGKLEQVSIRMSVRGGLRLVRDSRDGFGEFAALAAPPAGLDGDRRLPRAHKGAALPVHAHRCLDDGGGPVAPPLPRVSPRRHAPRPGLLAQGAPQSHDTIRITMQHKQGANVGNCGHVCVRTMATAAKLGTAIRSNEQAITS